MDEYDEQGQLPRKSNLPHYYGDFVRRYFLFAGLLILVATLVDKELFSFYVLLSLFGVVLFTILAGLTSPKKRYVIFIETIVAAGMFLIFESFAIDAYAQYADFFNPVFFLRQAIAVLFLFALYYSTKSMRYHF